MPRISVIVPVYQAEKYLPGCVESVVNQTFSDWELLLIDDGCTDASPALCDGYAAGDSRIRVWHKENGGVSSARNLGLQEARGEAIAFLDVDDRYTPECLETLWNLREQSGADTAACAHLNLWPDGRQEPSRSFLPASISSRRFKSSSWCPFWESGCASRYLTASSGATFTPHRSSARPG